MIRIGIDVSNLCNLHCSYCYNNDLYKNKLILDKHKLDVIFNKFKRSTELIHLDINGGEPTIYPYLKYLNSLIDSTSTINDVSLYTNGLFKHINIPKKINGVFFSFHDKMTAEQEQLWHKNLSSIPNANIIIVINNIRHDDRYNRIIGMYKRTHQIYLNPVKILGVIKDYERDIILDGRSFLDMLRVQTEPPEFCELDSYHLRANGTLFEDCGNVFYDLMKVPFERIQKRTIKCSEKFCSVNSLIPLNQLVKI